VQAQAEHRARYPDWRFRPGTNVDALAKRKTKDKNKDRPPERRRRSANTRDKVLAVATARGDGGGGGGDGGGGGSARCKKARGIIQDRRCTQIAELLARGVKGVALTSAVQAWDKESGVSNVTDGVFVTEQGVGVGIGGSDDSDGLATSNSNSNRGRKATTTTTKATMTKARSASSAQMARFTSSVVPLTAMYRRATSAPLAPEHHAMNAASPTSPNASVNAAVPTSVTPVPDFCPPPLSPASSVSYGSEVSFPDSDNMSVSAFPLRPSHSFPFPFFPHFSAFPHTPFPLFITLT
jgi:hypothetical protein